MSFTSATATPPLAINRPKIKESFRIKCILSVSSRSHPWVHDCPATRPSQEFWATRYAQLDLQFVSLHVTVDHIAGGSVSRPDPAVRLDHNRAIKVQHAEQFASYLVRGAEDETGKWSVVVPALSLWTNPTGVAFDPDRSFDAIDPIEFGVFSVQRTTPIGIWDDQHRVLGMYIAVPRKEEQIRGSRRQACKSGRGWLSGRRRARGATEEGSGPAAQTRGDHRTP